MQHLKHQIKLKIAPIPTGKSLIVREFAHHLVQIGGASESQTAILLEAKFVNCQGLAFAVPQGVSFARCFDGYGATLPPQLEKMLLCQLVVF